MNTVITSTKKEHAMKRLTAALAITAAALLVAPSTASAHHPNITGQAACTDNGWTVTWTVRADADRNYTWQITSPSGYTPTGWQADELPFTRTTSHPFTQASATETVSARWSNWATGTRTATAGRPQGCTPPTTTIPATTSTSTSSTSIPETSSTLVTTTAPTTSAPESTSTSSPSTSSTSSTSSVPDGTSTTTSSPVTLPTTTTDEPPVTTTGPTPSSTSPVTVSSLDPNDQTLPETGTNDALVAWAALLIAFGGCATLLSRRP